jgi:hypothetical protein
MNFLKIRKFENLHIIFWLIKDMSWAMGWKVFGVLMIAPTLLLSIYMSKYFREIPSERYHNYAVICWIIANSYWMTSEFYNFEEKTIYGSIQYVHLALIPFVSGLLIILYYHLFMKKKDLNS